MALFNELLGAGESLFKNEDALDLDFVPKLLPYREKQQHHVANCIKPLMQGRNGRNLFIFGAPGIGKTAAIKWVLRDLEETTDEVVPLYINCWQKNTTYKIMMDLCAQLDYKFLQNKNTEELFEVIKNIVNKKTVVFVFDEVDKVEEADFLYAILNDVLRKTVILITNYKSWIDNIEERVKSRLMAEILEFKQYSGEETKEILKQRVGYAFVPGAWDSSAFSLILSKAAESRDVRTGLFLLREAGLCAEENSAKRISVEHANIAVKKVCEFTQHEIDNLSGDAKDILSLVSKHSGKKIGDLFELYKKNDSSMNYKTFQRRIEKLTIGGFVNTEKIVGGKEGKTTIVSTVDAKKLQKNLLSCQEPPAEAGGVK
ncbi:AAA family ATPase [Candidatus Woesearchaeota archaeon]|nr:AAA family ATPase [Candidatus Woesearchaeota archaeon]